MMPAAPVTSAPRLTPSQSQSHVASRDSSSRPPQTYSTSSPSAQFAPPSARATDVFGVVAGHSNPVMGNFASKSGRSLTQIAMSPSHSGAKGDTSCNNPRDGMASTASKVSSPAEAQSTSVPSRMASSQSSPVATSSPPKRVKVAAWTPGVVTGSNLGGSSQRSSRSRLPAASSPTTGTRVFRHNSPRSGGSGMRGNHHLFPGLPLLSPSTATGVVVGSDRSNAFLATCKNSPIAAGPATQACSSASHTTQSTGSLNAIQTLWPGGLQLGTVPTATAGSSPPIRGGSSPSFQTSPLARKRRQNYLSNSPATRPSRPSKVMPTGGGTTSGPTAHHNRQTHATSLPRQSHHKSPTAPSTPLPVKHSQSITLPSLPGLNQVKLVPVSNAVLDNDTKKDASRLFQTPDSKTLRQRRRSVELNDPRQDAALIDDNEDGVVPSVAEDVELGADALPDIGTTRPISLLPYRLARPKGPRATYLDEKYYPLLVDLVMSFAPRDTLIALRCLSRSFRDRADSLLGEHLVFKPDHQLDGLEGRHPALMVAHLIPDNTNTWGWGYRTFWHEERDKKNQLYLTISRNDDVKNLLRNARIIDLKYCSKNLMKILRRDILQNVTVPVIRQWMWCQHPQDGPLPISCDTLVCFGWVRAWEPTGGYSRERWQIPPTGVRKIVLNLTTTHTKVPFTFHGLFNRRHPPASVEEVVFIFHPHSFTVTAGALEPLRELLPKLVRLIIEARMTKNGPRFTFVNTCAIPEESFPLQAPKNRLINAEDCESASTFEEYAMAAFWTTWATWRDWVEFITMGEYRARVGAEQFRVETLG